MGSHFRQSDDERVGRIVGKAESFTAVGHRPDCFDARASVSGKPSLLITRPIGLADYSARTVASAYHELTRESCIKTERDVVSRQITMLTELIKSDYFMSLDVDEQYRLKKLLSLNEEKLQIYDARIERFAHKKT
jgi:hypothetical protein